MYTLQLETCLSASAFVVLPKVLGEGLTLEAMTNKIADNVTNAVKTAFRESFEDAMTDCITAATPDIRWAVRKGIEDHIKKRKREASSSALPPDEAAASNPKKHRAESF